MRQGLAATGDLVLGPASGAWTLLGLAAATVIQGLRPGTWRRTVRAELLRHCHQMGITALPGVIFVGGLTGLGLVAQGLYWLRVLDQTEQIGPLLVSLLVRELAPVLIGLLLIGRSASVALAELHAIRASGGLRSLDAMGIDPFQLLVVPRTVAMSLSCFALTVTFVAAAMLFGYLGARAVGTATVSLPVFLGDLMGGIGLSDYLLAVIKPLLVGAAVSLVTCVVALVPGPGGREDGLRELLPRAFVASVVAVFALSGVLSVLL